MAHPICDMLDRREGKISRICDEGCAHWRFPHMDRPCTKRRRIEWQTIEDACIE